jgi:chemosensory pili system protein ChpA (sensor histidine kinase/response regulator)
MNLAGELVVSRSRLMSRLAALRGLQLDLSRSRRRLLEAVDSFREQYEFAKLDGQRAPAGGTRERGVPTHVDRRVPAFAAREPPGGGGPQDDVGTAAPWTTFGELELDRYEDVHILARRLAEIGSDISEVDGQLLREFGGFSDDSESFAALVSGMQTEVTRARMVPLEAVFSRLRLPVRDAAERERKDVRVVTRGEDVTVDKTIADALFQPLLHLVRNSVVHGVEAAEQRAGRGKPEAGTITLSARQESGQIVLEIGDDGAGLDLAALHARGLAMGLIAPSVPALDPAIKDLVFASGLSTRHAAGDVSGRGVGCDVVRRSIERLNGDIRVETLPMQGTTFIINLPLTLAITKALIVRHEGRTYAIPLYFAERILSAEDARIVAAGAERRIRAEGAYLSLRGMSELLGLAARARSGGAVVVLRVGDKRIALEVDGVTGQEEVVVKSLGDVLSGHPLFAGVTIRGTGELTLIMDVPGILEDRPAQIPMGKPAQPVAPSTSEGGPAQRAAAAPTAVPPLPASPGRPGPGAREARGREPAAPEPLRVLFVDDSVSVRKVAESALAAAGARVTLAVDGLDALEKLRAGSFDLVFTDLEMPRMHGYDLLRELRFLPQHADLPILIVSSRSQEKHQARARELGANDYITKPFSAQVLHEALRRWGKRRSPKAAGAPPERPSAGAGQGPPGGGGAPPPRPGAPPRPVTRKRDKT